MSDETMPEHRPFPHDVLDRICDRDAETSRAVLPSGDSTRERFAALGDAELDSTIAQAVPGSGSTEREGDGRDCDSMFTIGVASAQDQRFRVLRPHAQGGLGAVFVALDQELHREVALKQILDHHADDPGSRARFLREAEITGGLEHPGIVPVYGLGTYACGRPYYAMRFSPPDDGPGLPGRPVRPLIGARRGGGRVNAARSRSRPSPS
jgi:hypothetical protein